jgi:hypothetical protein
MVAEGHSCAWVSLTDRIDAHSIVRDASRQQRATAVFLDDADRYGVQLADMLADVAKAETRSVPIAIMRAGRIDRVIDRSRRLGIELEELQFPELSNDDIRRLLEILRRENRLGELTGKPIGAQVDAFRQRANRQLIVALIEATSGEPFRAKVEHELGQLEGFAGAMYATVGVATALRVGLSRHELLLACGRPDATAIEAIETLVRRRLILESAAGAVRLRHRVIAEVVLDCVGRDGRLRDIVIALLEVAAMAVSIDLRASDPRARRLRTLMNHDWLRESVGLRPAMDLLARVEVQLAWNYHYWLQRGSLALEGGRLADAERFLMTAYARESSDGLVLTELGYLRLKQAVGEISGAASREKLDEGWGLLDRAIAIRRSADPHQFEIFCRLGLDWLLRSDIAADERRSRLERMRGVIVEGREWHPSSEPIRELFVRVTAALAEAQ